MQGRICLVTGAGSGIGAATARVFGDAGAVVVLADINLEAALAVAGEIPGSQAIRLDIAQPAQTDAAVQEIVARHGRLDSLIHVAGVDDPIVKRRITEMASQGEVTPTSLDMTDEQWTRMLRINLDGCFYMVRAALKAMYPRRSGSIVTMSSIAGVESTAGYPHYSAAKAGVLGMTRALAREFIAYGIRLNSIAPDPVATPMSSKTPTAMLPKMPIGRYAEAVEVARTALFLASDDASYISGETIVLAPGRLTI